MNENIDLTKILKDCPEGTELWSDIYGKVQFIGINTHILHPIRTRRTDGSPSNYTKEGWFRIDFPASCLLWPSKDCRYWSKFTVPWYKKWRFDPKTLQPFDKVLVRDTISDGWKCQLFSHIIEDAKNFPYATTDYAYAYCIPYNDDTKHLIGTTKEAPEYYRYWED